MNIKSLLQLLAVSSALTLTACGGGGSGGDRPIDDDVVVQKDTDNDGTPDNQDDFPNDPNEQKDSDGDGVGDNADCAPNDASLANVNSAGECAVEPGTGTDGGGSGDTGSVKFNLSGAVTVVTTEKPATQADESGSSAPVKAMSNGRDLNTFVFHDTANKATKKSKYSDLVASGLSKEAAALAAESASSNLFVIDENGDLTFAAESDYDFKISYSVVWQEEIVTPADENDALSQETVEYKDWLFFAVDADEYWYSAKFMYEAGECGIFKVDVSTGDWTCVEKNKLAINIDDSYRKTMSDQKRKPLQIDEDGNVLFIAQEMTFNTQTDENGNVYDVYIEVTTNDNGWRVSRLRKVDSEGEGKYLTPDNFQITSFMSLPNDTVTYVAQDVLGNHESSLRLVKGVSSDAPETFTLEDSVPWGHFFYAKDDGNTLIYSDSNGWGKGVQFIQPVVDGPGRYILELDTTLFSDNDWNVSPKRLILADDGAMYGLFIEERYNSITESYTFIAKLKRMLPFSEATYAEFVIGNDWDDFWRYFDNGHRDVQVAKGFAYYIEDKEDPTLGVRSVIRAVRLADGERVDILEDDEWKQRYEIFNWKVSGDNLVFTGFDKTTSLSVSGSISLTAMKQGLGEEDFLTITETASVLNDSGRIEDMTLLRGGSASDVFTGNTPKVIKYYTDKENLSTASVEFSKYMNHASVEAGMKVQSVVYTDSGQETATEVPLTLTLWLNRTMHMIFDTDRTSTDPQTGSTNVTTEPLLEGTPYRISIDEEATDVEGFQLISGGSNLVWNWTTVPAEGWYNSFVGAVANVTDGNVGKYAQDEYNNEQSVDLATLGYPLNVKVEYAAKSAAAFETQLKLSDSHEVDWDKVTNNPTDDFGNTWERRDGFDVTRDLSNALERQYFYDSSWYDIYQEDKNIVTAYPITKIEGDATTNHQYFADFSDSAATRYVRIPGHVKASNGALYADRWVYSSDGTGQLTLIEIGSDPLNPISNGEVLYQSPDFYTDTVTGIKYFWKEVNGDSDWFDVDNNLIDWSKSYDYTGYGWENAAGERADIESYITHINSYFVLESTGESAEVNFNDTLWQQSFYVSDLNEDGMIDLAGLCYFPVGDEATECDYDSFDGAEAGENWEFAGKTWTWTSSFDANSFVKTSKNWNDFVRVKHGGNRWTSDDIRLSSLKSTEPDSFYNDWENEIFIRNGWSLRQWVKFEYTIITDTNGTVNDFSDDVTTLTLNMINSEGTIIQSLERDLFMDVSSASWQYLTGVEGNENQGFKAILTLMNGDAIIDEIKVTDLTTDTVLVEESFDSEVNIFNSTSVNDGDAATAVSRKKAGIM